LSNQGALFFKTNYKYNSDIYTGFNQWSWNDTYKFPFDLTGKYNGRIEVCYDFIRYPTRFYCDYKDYVIDVPSNTLTTILHIWEDSIKHYTFFNTSKYVTLRFCANESYVGSNNTNVNVIIDYNNDLIIDYNGSYTDCFVKYINKTDSKYYHSALARLISTERSDDAQFVFNYRIDGVCGDYYEDWDEDGFDNSSATYDWSEKCWGRCNDGIQNGNEISGDYGGRCGQCINATSIDGDLDFALLYDSGYVTTYPFDEQLCEEVKATSGIMVFFIIVFVFGLFLLILLSFSFGLIPILLFLFTGRFRFFWFLFRRKKEK